MTKIPEPVHTLAGLIDQAHEANKERPRPHLGASQIGNPCRRYLWLSFRWAVLPKFPGRILRLFRRGHHEENWIVEDLRLAGVDIQDTNPETGKQYFFKDGHFGGSMDGIIESGVPEAPSKRHIFEAKTHSLKSFKDVMSKGVEKSKPVHFAQMQVYMEKNNIDRALYFAICKNDDQIYTERVRLNKTVANKLISKAHEIIASDRMPEPLSADPSWYECKFCDAYKFCHQNQTTEQVNCRTCAHSTAVDDGTWHCARWDATVPTEFQYAGCDEHVIHPDLVPWQMKGGDEFAAIYEANGVEFKNGSGGLKSRDLLHTDETVAEIVKRFGGKVCYDKP